MPASPLTPLQLEIVPLLASGLTDQQIARKLHLNETGVKGRIERLRAATGTANRTAAAVTVLDMGLVLTPAGRVPVDPSHLRLLIDACAPGERAAMIERFVAAYPVLARLLVTTDPTGDSPSPRPSEEP